VKRLNVVAGERYDRVHNELLLDGVEDLARTLGTALFNGGAGILVLPSSIVYSTSTQRATIPAGTMLVDAAGNITTTAASVTSAVIPPALIGTVGIRLYGAIQVGTTETNALNRVKDVGSGETAFSANTQRVDLVDLQFAASAPAPLSNPTANYFTVATVTAWDGGSPNVPTLTANNALALGATIAPTSVGGVLLTLSLLAQAILEAKGTSDWDDVPSDDLEGLHTRVTTLEEEETYTQTLPIMNGNATASGGTISRATSGVTFIGDGAGATTGTYYLGLDLRGGHKITRMSMQIIANAASGGTITISEVDNSATATTLFTTTVHANFNGNKIWMPTPAHTVDSDKRYEVRIEVTNAAAGMLTVRLGKVSMQRA